MKDRLRKFFSRFSVAFLAVAVLLAASPAVEAGYNFVRNIIQPEGKSHISIGFEGVAYAITPDNLIPDSVTDHMDVYVQAAVDALSSDGGQVQLMAGRTYVFNDTVSRAINNVMISGDGKATYITNDASTPLFSAGSQTGWVFKDFRTDAGYVTLAPDTLVVRVQNGTSDFVNSSPLGTQTVPLNLYVNGTSGTDDINHGYSTGAGAFATIGYALSVLPQYIPVDLAGVTINVAAGNYTENLDLYDYYGSINIRGAMSQLLSADATGGAQGSGSTAARVQGTFTANQYNGKLIHFTEGANNDEYRIIGLTTTTNLYLVGNGLPAAPVNGDAYEVLDWATTLIGNQHFCNVSSMAFHFMELTASTGNYIAYLHRANVAFSYSNIDMAGVLVQAGILLDGGSYTFQWWTNNVASAGAGIHTLFQLVEASTAELQESRLVGSSTATDAGIQTNSGSNAMVSGCEITGFYAGLQVQNSSHVTTALMGPTVTSFIHGNAFGGTAASVSSITGTAAGNLTYGKKLDGNADANTSANEYADAATFGYVD